MVYVTHDQVEAMTMADRIAVMKDGVIQQVATPLDLYDQPANLFVAGFIGTPSMNFFKGHFRGKAGSLEFDAGSFRVAVPLEKQGKTGAYLDQAIVMGIRPEHVGSPIAEADANSARISAVVEITEPMGSETHVYLKTGEHSFIAKADPHRAGKMDETMSVALMPSKLHFFDPATSAYLT